LDSTTQRSRTSVAIVIVSLAIVDSRVTVGISGTFGTLHSVLPSAPTLSSTTLADLAF
jgi:hypothetical protein